MPVSFDDVELELIMSAAASLPPAYRAELLRRVAHAMSHEDFCGIEGAVQRALMLVSSALHLAA